LDFREQLFRGLVARGLRDPFGVDRELPVGSLGDLDGAVAVLELDAAAWRDGVGAVPGVGRAARRDPDVEITVPDIDVAGGGKQGRGHAGRSADRDPRTKGFHGSSWRMIRGQGPN